jgi:SWI/SNF-related matrix-associated actin-dependent regulator of chromatin subfamily A-like protein 1
LGSGRPSGILRLDMDLLRWNPRLAEYVVTTSEPVKAEHTGLTLSTTARGPNGERIYFTKDPYAALNFYPNGDFETQDRLGGLISDYQRSWSLESPNVYPCGGTKTPRPYQNAACDYILDRFGRKSHALLADAPGVGKTFTGILTANAIQAKRCCAIVPGRIRGQWTDAIRESSNIPKVRVYPVMRGSDGIATWANWTVISYDLVRNPAIHAALCAIHWDLLLLDEAHLLKELTARRTQAIFGGGRREEFKDSLANHAEHILAMTGTPLPNRPRECYTLTRALCWDAIDFITYEAFRYRFNPSARMESGYVREEKGRLPELQARLRCNFMVRRLKEQVLPWLPDKTYEFAYVETTGAIADVIRRERMLDYDIKDLKKPFGQFDGELSTIRREMGEAKVPQAIEHIKYLLDVVEIPKLVVFSHHRSVMDSLREALSGYGVVEVRGGMSAIASDNSKKTFMHRSDLRIFSGQLDASGVGMDGLQEVASYVLIVEPSWVPGVNEQAIDRLHRDGQRNPVIAQFLVAEGSLDETILASVIGKTVSIDYALDNRHKVEI